MGRAGLILVFTAGLGLSACPSPDVASPVRSPLFEEIVSLPEGVPPPESVPSQLIFLGDAQLLDLEMELLRWAGDEFMSTALQDPTVARLPGRLGDFLTREAVEESLLDQTDPVQLDEADGGGTVLFLFWRAGLGRLAGEPEDWSVLEPIRWEDPRRFTVRHPETRRLIGGRVGVPVYRMDREPSGRLTAPYLELANFLWKTPLQRYQPVKVIPPVVLGRWELDGGRLWEFQSTLLYPVSQQVDSTAPGRLRVGVRYALFHSLTVEVVVGQAGVLTVRRGYPWGWVFRPGDGASQLRFPVELEIESFRPRLVRIEVDGEEAGGRSPRDGSVVLDQDVAMDRPHRLRVFYR